MTGPPLTGETMLARILALDPTRQAEALRLAQRAYRLASDAQPGSAIETEEALWDYVWQTWGIAIPRQHVCPQHSTPFDAFADAYFARDSMIIWEGSRGFAGKSMLLSVLGLTIATTRGGDVNILGGSGEQSRRVLEYMGKAWDAPQAPRQLLVSDLHTWRTKLTNGATIQALLASSTSVRGPHIPTLLLDETDEFTLPLFDAAMGQTMGKPGQPAVTVMSSTHHYPDGTFTEIKKRAQERGWRHHVWCYRESLAPHGWLIQDEVARKQREVTQAMWTTEYELQEPSGENRAIDADAVTACFRRELGEYEGKPREYLELEPPVHGAIYAHGADWARKQDWTEIVTLRCDVMPFQLVAYERMQRVAWPVMVGRLDARIQRYGGSVQRPNAWKACHDGSGLGDVVAGYLEHEAEGMVLAGRARADLFSECVSGIEHGEVMSPFIVSLEGQVRYCTVDDLYGAGHPPDGFVALALAYRATKALLYESVPADLSLADTLDLTQPNRWAALGGHNGRFHANGDSEDEDDAF